MNVIVEISARHLHLSQEHLDILYGAGYKLTPKKDLSQPGQFACAEKVEVIGPKGSMKMSILGPVRPATQVEVSMTDARSLGIKAPVRESGDVKGSGACKLVGPCGEIDLAEGVMVAKRHLHIIPEDAAAVGIVDKQIVKIAIKSAERSLVFDDVIARVSPTCATRVHLDTDEANAAGISGEVEGEVIL